MKSDRNRHPPPQLIRASIVISMIVLLHPDLRQATSAMQEPASERRQIDRLLRNYELLKLDLPTVARQVRESGAFLLATADHTFDVALEPYDLRTSDYRAEEELPGGMTRSLPSRQVHTYRGTAARLGESEARFSVRDGAVEGVILTPAEWYYVEPLRNFIPSADPSEVVYYRRSDVRMEALGTCGTTLAHRIGEAHRLVEPQALPGTSGISTADIATEADYEYVQASGGSAQANDSILDVLNQVDGIYRTELSLSLRVVYQHTWTTADDPYTSASASAMLGEFRNYWNGNFYSVPFDLAHMWTGKDMEGSTVGIAYLSVICAARSYSYGISQRFTSAPGKYILSAHEIGHNFGASHPDQAIPPETECAHTIMSSSVGTGFTFCPFSRSEIASHVASNPTCYSSGLAAPSNLTAAAASASRINLSWQDNSPDEVEFAVERKEGAYGAWARVAGIAPNTTSFADTGLAGSVTYYYRVRANGAEGSSAYSNEASATTFAGLVTITGMLPISGRVGTPVTITGTNFQGATAVRFHTTYASSFTVVTGSQIAANVPAGATTGYITVSAPAGTATSPAVFTVTGSRCDLSADGSLNILDIQLLINTILGLPGSLGSADINGDGGTNVLDLQVLINVVLGLTGCPG